MPLDWAMGQGNLANVECAFFDRTGEAVHPDREEGYVHAARQVFTAAGASHYQKMADGQLANIAERRGE